MLIVLEFDIPVLIVDSALVTYFRRLTLIHICDKAYSCYNYCKHLLVYINFGYMNKSIQVHCIHMSFVL